MLGLAFFKSLVKEHGKAFFEPIGKALQREQIKSFSPANPLHAWKLRKELGSYARWVAAKKLARRDRQQVPSLDARLAGHLEYALQRLNHAALEISCVMTKHQLKLADRQCRMAEMSQRIQDVITILVTTLWGHQQKDKAAVAAVDILCQDLRRKLTGERPTDRYFKDVNQLADMIIGGGFEAIAG